MIIERNEDAPVNSTADLLPPTIKQVMAADTDPQTAYTLAPNIGLERFWPVLLAVILVMGAWLRFSGINWDQFTHLHPDERFLTDVAHRLESETLGGYFRTSESTLNPHNLERIDLYVYGNFPMTVTRLVAEAVQSFCGEGGCEAFGRTVNYTAYDGVHLVGRALSAVVDLIAIGFTFMIGRRLYGTKVGLFAAFLMAFAALPIQQSHFFTADNWGAAMTTIAVYFAVRASENNKLKWYALFGLFLGLAVASRINIAPLAALAGVSAFIWLSRYYSSWQDVINDRKYERILQAVSGVALAALISFVTFRTTMPYAFNDFSMAREELRVSACHEQGIVHELDENCPVQNDDFSNFSPAVIMRVLVGFSDKWEENMERIQNLQKPDAMFPPAIQWTDRTAMVFPFTTFTLWGVGIFAGLAAWAGLAWAFMRVARNRPEWRSHLIILLWSITYFGFMGTRWVKNMRYFLPVYPTLLILAAWAIFNLMKWKKTAGMIAMFVVMTGTMLYGMAFHSAVYGDGFTRLNASRWMFDNVPTAVSLIYEQDGEEKSYQLPMMRHQFTAQGVPLTVNNHEVPFDGVITAVRMNYMTMDGQADFTTLIQDAAAPSERLTSGQVLLGGVYERTAEEIPVRPFDVSAGDKLNIEIKMPTGGIVDLDTSALMQEHWDDALPANVDGKSAFGSYYRGIKDPNQNVDGAIPITGTDNQRKLDGFVTWLDKADYVVLSSQRAVWSTPRIPQMFPMTTAYYDALFNGELGFELAYQEHATMNIGPFHFNDNGGSFSFGSEPHVGWPPPSDLTSSEEAFSVYDHPPVWIFEKTDEFSAELVRNVLGAVDISQATTTNPGQATKAKGNLMLTADAFDVQKEGGTFSDLFNPDGFLNKNPLVAAFVWYLSIVLLGLITFPLTATVMSGLPTRGYMLSRILSIALISWFGWMMASLEIMKNGRPVYLLGLLIVVGISALLALRNKDDLLTWVRDNLRYIVITEALALGLYLFFLLIRANNPDVWHVIWGGEKPMDLTYFTATLKSTYFPPYDPWYAGGKLNYYYYGFVYVGVLTKLLGIVPTVAYNLILPMLYSFTGMGAFSVAYNLYELSHAKAQRHEGGGIVNGEWLMVNGKLGYVAGVVALCLCVLLGNLGQAGVVWKGWSNTGDPSLTGTQKALDGARKVLIGGETPRIQQGDYFWTASRAITVPDGEIGPITEFPFFTFIYGDMHAHMISLPLTLLALGWVISFALRPLNESRTKARRHEGGGIVNGEWLMVNGKVGLTWFVGALAIGSLYPTNSWDFPTYVVIGGLGVVLYNLRRHGTLTLALIGDVLLQAGVLTALSYALYLPFSQHFGAGFSEVARWEGATTGWGSYLIIWGLFLLLVVVHLAREVRGWLASQSVEALERLGAAVPLLIGVGALTVLASLGGFVMGLQIMPIALPIIVLSGLLALSNGLSPARRIILALISSAFALTLFVDIWVIEGTVGRMNTVFKFYMQVWTFLSVVGGVALAGIIGASKGWGIGRKTLFYGLLVPMVLVGLSYPVLAARAKFDVRMSEDAPMTLDGMAFMETAQYGDSGQQVTLAEDYEALQWMQRNIEGSPVVAEAYSGNYYRSIGNRVAMYTGLPSIIGWNGHQSQQRAAVPNSRIGERTRDVETLYNTLDVNAAQDVIARYDVGYIYVGQLERVYYDAAGINKFVQMARNGDLRPVYDQNGVIIYEVLDVLP